MHIYIKKNEVETLKYLIKMKKAELLHTRHSKGELNYIQFKELLAINSLLNKLKSSSIYALY